MFPVEQDANRTILILLLAAHQQHDCPRGPSVESTMGILIQFPQPGTCTPPGKPPSIQTEAEELHLAAAYRRDLDRAIALLFEHVLSGAYDGVALILKPISSIHKPALVVGGFYRHRLTDAADATMHLHLALKLRGREQTSLSQVRDTGSAAHHSQTGQQGTMDKDVQDAP